MKKPISENINRSPRHEKIIKSPRHKTPNHNNSSSHQCYTDIYKYGIILSVILALAAIWLSITLHHFTTSTTKQMNNDIPSMNDNDSTLLKIRNDLKKAKGIIHDDDSDDVVDDNNNKLPQPSQQFHIVFSTGCSAYQDWQSYVFFYHIWKSGQQGNVTRIVSGCTLSKDRRNIRNIFNEQIKYKIPTGDERFHIHFTPDYSNIHFDNNEQQSYKFFNKPYGIKHWMEHQLKFQHRQNDGYNDDEYNDDEDDDQVIIPNSMKDTIIIIMDPDQIMMRPFSTNMDYTNDTTMIWHGGQPNPNNPSTLSSYKTGYQIKNGVPGGQFYHLGATWMENINGGIQSILDAITLKTKKKNNNTNNGLDTWTYDDVLQFYDVGPPYIATAYDMYRIVIVWSNIVVPVYKLCNRQHLSEMFAYSTAAAYLKLRHLITYNFMVSNTDVYVNEEGWNDEINTNTNDQSINDNSKINANDDQYFLKWSNPTSAYSSINDKINYTDLPLPYMLHYCQEYRLGPYSFSKYRFPQDILSCSHPMLLEPPSLLMLNINDNNDNTNIDVANVGYKYWTTLNLTSTNRNRTSCGMIALMYKTYTKDGVVGTYGTLKEIKRNTFFLCHIITKINDALEFWKNTNCNNNNTNTNTDITNYQKIYVERDNFMTSLLLKPNPE